MSQMTPRNRFRGCLLGLAVGDALGTTLEFKRPGTFRPINDMVGGGPFHLEPGQWTDDTSMALCLAASLIEKGEFDAMDQMQRYVRWWEEGLLIRHWGMLRHRNHHIRRPIGLHRYRRALCRLFCPQHSGERLADAAGSCTDVFCK